MDRGAWKATVHRVAESNVTEQLTLSQRSLRFFFPILFCIFCSVGIISTILSSRSLIPSSVSVILLLIPFSVLLSFPGGSDGKASACNVGDPGLIPGLGRSPGKGNGNPLQYFYLENPTDGGAWWATVHGAVKSWTRLSDLTFTSVYC